MAAHAAAPPGVKKLAKFYEDATTAFIAFSGPDERYGARPPPQSQGLGEALVPILLPTEQAEPLGEEKDKYVVSTMLSLFLTEARAGRFRRARALDEAHYYILDGGNIPCEGAIGGRFALQPVSRGEAGEYAKEKFKAVGPDIDQVLLRATPERVLVLYCLLWSFGISEEPDFTKCHRGSFQLDRSVT